MRLLIVCLLFAVAGAGRAADPPAVLVSIPPIHSLVAGVMEGVGEPLLLISGGASPHTYSLRPSEAGTLARAEVIFWVGESLESMLDKPIATLGGGARVVELSTQPQIELLPAREGGIWARGGGAQGVPADSNHDHGRFDPHLWLSPDNARAVVEIAQETLCAADPDNATRYRHNAERLSDRIAKLERELAVQLQPLGQVPYLVFHDAYQYFEQAFGLHPLGAVAIDPERPPGARRLAQLRSLIQKEGVRCLFSEPQLPAALVAVILEGSNARGAALDPLGAGLKPGPSQWFELMEGVASDLAACLPGEPAS